MDKEEWVMCLIIVALLGAAIFTGYTAITDVECSPKEYAEAQKIVEGNPVMQAVLAERLKGGLVLSELRSLKQLKHKLEPPK